VKRLMVDSSIIVSSLLENEPRHKEARKIWDAVLAGRNVAILPYSVFVEVVAAVRKQLLEIEAVSFVGLDDKSAQDAAEIAVKTSVRGMDALVLQVARDFGTELMSFDEEMMAKARGHINR
jgi:predicted nucleic acid-binding protein